METTQADMELILKQILSISTSGSTMDIILKYFNHLNDQQIKQFGALENLYSEWNNKINVISRKDILGLYEKHILHSLSIAAVFDFKTETEILDIGTGGGLPGIPLAIFFPNVKFHLIDSIKKKLTVVQAIADAIKLKNISTTHIRAEQLKNHKYDFIVSRAVAPLKDLWKWSKPLLKKPVQPVSFQMQVRSTTAMQNFHDDQPIGNPGLIALKGGNLELEINESGIEPFVIPISNIFSGEFFKEKYLLYAPLKNTTK